MKNLLLKKLYSFFKKIFVKKNIQTKTTLKSLKKGPVIKNIGINEIKNEGKVINILFLKLDINIKQKN